MRKLLLSLEILLAIAGVTIYLAAKLHFFISYRNDLPVYLSQHWPFWAALAIVVVALAGVDGMRRRTEHRQKKF
jgi:hypothetical protein